MNKEFIKTNIYSSEYKLVCSIRKNCKIVFQQYDDKGRLINANNKWSYKYNDRNDIIEKCCIIGNTTTYINYTYDENGNIVKEQTNTKSPSGITEIKSIITYVYDNENRLIIENTNGEFLNIISYDDNIIRKKVLEITKDQSRIIVDITTIYDDSNRMSIVINKTSPDFIYKTEYLYMGEYNKNNYDYVKNVYLKDRIIKTIRCTMRTENDIIKKSISHGKSLEIKSFMKDHPDILLSRENYIDGILSCKITTDISHIGEYTQITYYDET